MRVLVTGSRTWTDEVAIRTAIDEILRHAYAAGDRDIVIVHGCAVGADQIADRWARHRRGEWPVSVERHPADWAKHGRRAGYVRNSAMVAAGADVCLAFVRDESKGASMCADLAEEAGIRTVRYVPRPEGTDD
jgi:hypothetical protein